MRRSLVPAKKPSDEDQSPLGLSGINKPGSHPSLNPRKKKKATKMLSSIVLIFKPSESQIHPNFSSLSASSKYMKYPNWFTQNRLLSHLRIATAGALIAAAMVSAIAAFQPDPPDTRLTNDNGANGGYVSAYTLATGNPYTDASTTAALPREPSARSGSATIARRTVARASSARSSRAIPTTARRTQLSPTSAPPAPATR